MTSAAEKSFSISGELQPDKRPLKDERASSTALLIAASMVVIDGHQDYAGARPGTSGDFCSQVLQAHSVLTRLFLRLAHRRWFFRVVRFLEQSTIPGILRHYALRKKWIASFAREALHDGITQVVVLGAGLDPLALTLHREFPDARFWEIDHPATQRLKTKAMGHVDAERFQFAAVNLVSGQVDLAMLNQSGFDPARGTLWIAEGLFMYFPEAVVVNLLNSAAGLSAKGSRLAFTFMEPRRDGRVRFRNQRRLVDWWLSWRGEPFVWGLERSRISQLAAPWQVERVVDENDLRALDSSLGSFRLAAGELICQAELR
jgi:methyltransferase (TIGR00027 family)